MNRYDLNGSSNGTAQYETPFADIPVKREFSAGTVTSDGYLEGVSQEIDTPFSRTYEVATAVAGAVTPAGEEYVNLLAELNDKEFQESLYDMANEVEDTWRSKVSDEIAMGSNYLPFAAQQAAAYFAPVQKGTSALIDRVAQHFSGNDLSDHSQASVESFFETLEFSHEGYTPAQEQFFGKIFNKVKSVVRKGVELAKKGISVVGKFMPLNIILKKIKGLIKPLLDKVLKFAIGKLPKNLQPYAQTLAKKFLNLETDDEQATEIQGEDSLASVQAEFDDHIASLVFSSAETDAETTVVNYELSGETRDRNNTYGNGYSNITDPGTARHQFINDLKNLQEGESPVPAIERFLPALVVGLQPVLKIAINLAGRQKVINFLAGLLSKLISKYVPANVAKPLSASIVDAGMNAFGLEITESANTELGYEAIANTLEQTVQQMEPLTEASLNDTEELTMNLLQSFEQAASDNFPPQYIREELRPSKQKAVWVAMPLNNPVKYYKKFTHIYDITIDAQTAAAVTTYRHLPLSRFLRDKYGLDSAKAIKAKVHLYELNSGGKLSQVSKYEKLPGLNARQPKSYIQLLPLTKQAASLLLKQPALGRDVKPEAISSRFKSGAGQRFYYLEIEGVRLRIPLVNRTGLKHPSNALPAAGTESRSADIQGVINFIKSEIKLNYYFSEEDAKEIVEKLNKKDFLGAALSIRQTIKTVLNDVLVKNVSTKVKIVHEALPELYLEYYPEGEEGFAPLSGLGDLAGKELILKLVEKLVGKLSSNAYDAVVTFFKGRAAEFKTAQAQPQDGVTIKLVWSNIPGMSTLRTIINAVRGKLSLGNLSELSIPSIPAPSITIAADKRFE